MPTKNSADDKLTMETAEKVFGWRDVHEHDGKLIGKKPDRLGRWRTATVPNYAHDAVQAFAIDERMKQLGRMELYLKELATDQGRESPTRVGDPRTSIPGGANGAEEVNCFPMRGECSDPIRTDRRAHHDRIAFDGRSGTTPLDFG